MRSICKPSSWAAPPSPVLSEPEWTIPTGREREVLMTDRAYDLSGGFHPASAPDYLPLPQLRELKLGRLRAIVRRAYENVEIYRKRMDDKGFIYETGCVQDEEGMEPLTERWFKEDDIVLCDCESCMDNPSVRRRIQTRS